MALGAHKRVRLHTKDGTTFEGLLIKRRPLYVLELADLIEPAEDKEGTITHQLQGRVNVERDNIRFFQVLS